MNNNNTHTYKAVAVLAGTVVGAGILGIPYVIAKAGFLTGIAIILILGLAILMLNLFVGEIVLRTPGNHQLPGYAGKYLGKWGKIIMTFTLLLGIYGALIAYIIGEGESLAALFGGTPLVFSLIFFSIVAIIVFLGLKTVVKSEAIFVTGVSLLILLIAAVAIFSGKMDLSNLAEFNPLNLFIPYGVILFAFLGTSSIPQMKEYLSHDRKLMRKAIIIGSLIPIVAYLLFAFITLAITGTTTTEIATIGLGNALGPSIVIFGNLLAIFAMFTSFLTLSLAMKELYHYDLKLNKHLGWALTMFVPLIIFLLGVKSFIQVIGLTGAFVGGIDGILIVLMYWRARKLGKRQPEYKLGKMHLVGIFIIILFILGIIYQLFNL
ncbi:MAG: aromatic amino acid transport family protein [Candidatus Woesearchaeota archaeon]